jgi:hypothetical protein
MRCLRPVVALAVLLAMPATLWAAPEGQATWAAHVSLVPTWFDPVETTTGTQFMVTFALHDALIPDYFYSAPYEDVRLKGK